MLSKMNSVLNTKAIKAVLSIACVLLGLSLLAGCSSGKSNSYIGDWKVLEAMGSFDGTQIDERWEASGTVKVTSDRMTIDATVAGSPFKETGSFQGLTSEGRPVYETSNGMLLGIGKSNGVYIVAFSTGDASDGAIDLHVERVSS